jgi:hypothetical protein
MVWITSQNLPEKPSPANHKARKETAAMIAERISTFWVSHLIMDSMTHLHLWKVPDKDR